MADVFIEGFDKYGPINAVSANVVALLLAGEWTSASSGIYSIVAGLSSTGDALQIAYQATASFQLTKTLASSYSRLIGGIRFSATLSAGQAGFGFGINGTFVCTITINSSGTISLRTGGATGTALATSSATVSANSTHYLEWDITFGASSAYQVWLDGVSIFSGTGNTGNGSTTANQFVFLTNTSATTITFDDFYLFDSTTSTNNAVLNTNPRIETQSPTGDSSVQFTFGAAILGSANEATASTSAPGANELFLRKFTTGPTGQLASVACIPGATSSAANFKAVVYADSAGSPTGSTLATGTQATGTVTGATLVSAFASPPTLAASTAYWLGFITDTSVTLQQVDSTTTGQIKSNTYGSGPPSNPSMTTGQPSWIIYGNMTGIAVDWYEVSVNPPPGDISYVFSSSSGFEDLYSFPALTTTPNVIYTVAVKGNVKKSDTGTRTVTLQCKSGTTDSSGSAAAASPATTYGWMDSFFDTDPNTGVAWTPTGLNSATSGVKVAS